MKNQKIIKAIFENYVSFYKLSENDCKFEVINELKCRIHFSSANCNMIAFLDIVKVLKYHTITDYYFVAGDMNYIDIYIR